MQTFFVWKGVKGYYRPMRRLEYVNHPRRAEIGRRVKINEFFGLVLRLRDSRPYSFRSGG
jgi:hypothetical protein